MVYPLLHLTVRELYSTDKEGLPLGNSPKILGNGLIYLTLLEIMRKIFDQVRNLINILVKTDVLFS
jgi:major intracellular serine protease